MIVAIAISFSARGKMDKLFDDLPLIKTTSGACNSFEFDKEFDQLSRLKSMRPLDNKRLYFSVAEASQLQTQ